MAMLAKGSSEAMGNKKRRITEQPGQDIHHTPPHTNLDRMVLLGVAWQLCSTKKKAAVTEGGLEILNHRAALSLDFMNSEQPSENLTLHQPCLQEGKHRTGWHGYLFGLTYSSSQERGIVREV